MQVINAQQIIFVWNDITTPLAKRFLEIPNVFASTVPSLGVETSVDMEMANVG